MWYFAEKLSSEVLKTILPIKGLRWHLCILKFRTGEGPVICLLLLTKEIALLIRGVPHCLPHCDDFIPFWRKVASRRTSVALCNVSILSFSRVVHF